MQGGTVVRVVGVSKQFDDVPAVNDVSLEVDKGEFVSLLGPSGCGKSTLLRIIAGFEPADRGSVFLEGADFTNVAPHRRPVNMVFQSYALFPHLTIFENVAFGLRRKKTPEADITRLVRQFLELVGLGGFGARYPAQLSGGQQQRVALARALVNRPSVLLLDEPLAALDLKLRKRMQVELKVLQQELGISFIYVTHDQEEALALSDRIAVMNDGRVLQYGPAREVYDHPKSEFVANFLGEANILHCDVRSTGDPMVLGIGDYAIRARAPIDPAKVGSSVLLAIRPEDVVVGSARPETDNVLPCVVDNRVFSGTAPTVFVNVGGATIVSVRSANRATFDSLQPGMAAFIGWQAARGVIVSGGNGGNDRSGTTAATTPNGSNPHTLYSRTALLLPAIVVVLIFFVLPVVLIISESVYSNGKVSFGTFGYVLGDVYYAQVLWRSLWLSFVSTAACVLLGYPIAYYATRVADQRYKRYIYMIILAPLFTSAVIRVIAWTIILGNKGILNSAMMKLDIIESPVRMLYTETAIMTGLVYTMIPFAVLTIASVLENLDGRLEEAARDLGATPFETFVRVTLPLSLPGVSAGAILVFALCLSAYVTPALLGGGRIKVIASIIFEQFLRNSNWPLGSAISCLLLVVTGFVIFLYGRALARRRPVRPAAARA